ncbi:unnamed protein product, partial [Polarella glacialis]
MEGSSMVAFSALKTCHSTAADKARSQALEVLRQTLRVLTKAVKHAETEAIEMGKAPDQFCIHRQNSVFRALNATMDDPSIGLQNEHQPRCFGLVVPELVLREAYIVTRDIVPLPGWETGRDSEPAFMDMNLHALRGDSEPKIVLYQVDHEDPMNPRGLVMAYAEHQVHPLVSDFDPFLIGSSGMSFQATTSADAELMRWCLKGTEEIISGSSGKSWTSQWLQILKRDGFQPKLPKFGFGDQTSYSITSDLVDSTVETGAVRHGAECFNWYFPQ